MKAFTVKSAFFAVLIALGLAFMPLQTARAADAYEVDPVHSSAIFGIEHLGVAMFYGSFNVIEGKIVLDENNPDACSVALTIPVKKVDTRNKMRDDHLKSKDFFKAADYPDMSFKSTRVEKIAEGLYEVQGVFSMAGTARDMTFEVAKTGVGLGMQKEARVGFSAEFTLKRSDFGMVYGLNGLLGDKVKVCLSIEGIKKE